MAEARDRMTTGTTTRTHPTRNVNGINTVVPTDTLTETPLLSFTILLKTIYSCATTPKVSTTSSNRSSNNKTGLAMAAVVAVLPTHLTVEIMSDAAGCGEGIKAGTVSC